MDETYAFTLNLGHQIDEKARAAAANDNSPGAADFMRRRIMRELKPALDRLGLPLFWFALEISPDGKLHIHGAIAARKHEIPAIEKALCRAGGAWTPVPGSSQVHTKRQFNAEGWFNYCDEDLAKTGRVIDGPLFYIPDELRRRARARYMADRDELIEFLRGENQRRMRP
ncbi:hypothetical protein [Terrihabitans rhizophilus]|uniref:Replication initiation protein n=1 Tax=Terrihabitans rhizophilus TaxID=3092662 RepID=A0ABU4RNM2_9HYPH|nr:hypothetical protein [Terrihabitans sp. PJ23]MDX6806437.1 hypothetical protein [Terrihabitans sp. PJ23]